MELIVILLVVLAIIAGIVIVVFKSIKFLLHILWLGSMIIFIVFIFASFAANKEIKGFQEELRTQKVYYLLDDNGNIIAGIEVYKQKANLMAREEKQAVLLDNNVRKFIFAREAFSSLPKNVSDEMFVIALNERIEADGSGFIVDAYINDKLTIEPTLKSLAMIKSLPFSDRLVEAALIVQ